MLSEIALVLVAGIGNRLAIVEAHAVAFDHDMRGRNVMILVVK